MKIKLIFSLLALSVLLNCKDEDTTGDYIGTWIATNIDITDCENFTLNDFRSVQCNDTNCYKIEFNADGSYAFQRGLDTERGTWSADGAVISLCFDEEGEQVCTSATAIIASGGTLRLSFEEGGVGCITAYIMERDTSS